MTVTASRKIHWLKVILWTLSVIVVIAVLGVLIFNLSARRVQSGSIMYGTQVPTQSSVN